jgi:tetratricopeptide (TPR) repeat protein
VSQAAAAPERPARPVARAAAEPPPEPDSPIRITTGRLKLNPVIAHGYQALMEGDLATAQRDYAQVLKSEPKNIDALHGLAAIDIRQGRFDAAENHYLRALESDPKDAAAQAGLIGLRGQVDPVQSESRLKILLAGQPDSPFLNFALGNLYARQGRWNEAQQAYFRAYSGDPDNPDYQFNLAISLDQLRQPKLALQYYQGALAAAAQRPAAFDKNQATGRVRELQQ